LIKYIKESDEIEDNENFMEKIEEDLEKNFKNIEIDEYVIIQNITLLIYKKCLK
jgi:hypothetical protein